MAENEELLDYDQDQAAEEQPEQAAAGANDGAGGVGVAANGGAPAEDGGGSEQGGEQHMEEDKAAIDQAAAAAKDPSDPMNQPPHGTEVYIANLAMDAPDGPIKTFVSKAGEVYQLRVPKNPDGRNRGYGFVVYMTREAAQHAVESLTNQELPEYPGRKVRLNESQSKNKLYFGNLPRSYTQLQLEQELKSHTQGVEGVELVMDRENPTINRGFAFVTYYNYACADAARRKFTETEHNTVGGRPVHVTWAEPKKVEDTSQVRAIFVGNLPSTVTEEKLQALFQPYGEIEKVMLPYAKDTSSGATYREYGFVHFKERSGAQEAVTKCKDTRPKLDDKELQVALARPHHNEAQGPGGMGPGGRGSGRGYPGGYSSYGGRGGRGDYGGGRGGYGYDDGYGYSGGGGRGGYNRGYYEEEYYEDDYYGEGSGYGSGGSGGYGGGYGRSAAAAAAPAATTTAATVMVPVQLPSGQVGYMVVPAAGAAAAAATAGGSGGPVRRAATGYGPAYSSGSSYGRGSSSYGAGGGGGSYRPY